MDDKEKVNILKQRVTALNRLVQVQAETIDELKHSKSTLESRIQSAIVEIESRAELGWDNEPEFGVAMCCAAIVRELTGVGIKPVIPVKEDFDG
jgi:hypothetical protein